MATNGPAKTSGSLTHGKLQDALGKRRSRRIVVGAFLAEYGFFCSS